MAAPRVLLAVLLATALSPTLGTRVLPPAPVSSDTPNFFNTPGGTGVDKALLGSGSNYYAKFPQAIPKFDSTPGVELDPSSLEKFVDELPRPEVLDGTSGDTLFIGMFSTYQKFHRDILPTKVYAYGTSQETAAVPGPTIEATRSVDIQVVWTNLIPDEEHMFTVDQTIPHAQPSKGGVPAVVHRHGAETESKYDGHPDAWFTYRGDTGPTYVTNIYNYTNHQLPAMLWFHDHTIGYTALNDAAGLVGGTYIIRDPNNTEAAFKDLLPSGEYEMPLVLMDKSFFANGSTNYPNVGDNPSIHPNWLPEYLGNTIIVNGRVWPYKNVSRSAYRFRFLDATNARAFNLRFICASREDYDSNYQVPLQGSPLSFYQIGSDGGYLNEPILLDEMLMAVGQRADVIIDFSQAPMTCHDVILTNDANAPYPGGDPVDNNTGIVMKFHLEGEPAPAFVPPSKLGDVPPLNTSNVNVARFIDMVEIEDPVTGSPVVLLMKGLGWDGPPTETPIYGDTEVWFLINVTPDAHPMHLHLIQHRLISRRPIDVDAYKNGSCSFRNPLLPDCYTGPARPAEPREAGWVDTTNALPGEVTAILAQFTMQDGNEFFFDPTTAPGYVWHCHIVNHEDNQKMRPLFILPEPASESETGEKLPNVPIVRFQ